MTILYKFNIILSSEIFKRSSEAGNLRIQYNECQQKQNTGNLNNINVEYATYLRGRV